MKKKATKLPAILTFFFLLCSGALLATGQIYNSRKDLTAPEITIEEEKFGFEAGTEEAALLNGVTAFDDRDGDVTRSLRIRSFYYMGDSGKAVVEYAAKDNNNNVGTAIRVVEVVQTLSEKE